MEQGEQSRPPATDRVVMTLRVPVPGGLSPEQEKEHIKSTLQGWNVRWKIDDRFPPQVITPPRRKQRELESLGRTGQKLVTVRGWVEREDVPTLSEQLGKLKSFGAHLAGDARIDPFAVGRRRVSGASGATGIEPTGTATGTVGDVVRHLGVDRIWSAGYRGDGIVVGVVDAGMTAYTCDVAAGEIPAIPCPPATGQVIGGWPPDTFGTTAVGWAQHGNMIAYDVHAIAPAADLWDMRIWEPLTTFDAYVSHAVSAYRMAIAHHRASGVPHILTNSWGVYDSATSPDYAFNPDSDFAWVVEEAIEAGILVLFAAGNCGDGCGYSDGSPCGEGDRGPGYSILGPNGHPRVMTVGAATVLNEWCGYTSQGPAALTPYADKPDFCGISEFAGYFPGHSTVRPCDGGTSAATAVVAGVVALLKQRRPDLTQEEAADVLRYTARDIGIGGVDSDSGAGIIHALDAFSSL
jgi:subtilisin family serine protease